MVLPGPYHVTAHVISAMVLCVGHVPTKPQAIAVIAYLIRNILLLLYLLPIYRDKRRIRTNSTLIFPTIASSYLPIPSIERIHDIFVKSSLILIDILSIFFIRNLNIISRGS